MNDTLFMSVSKTTGNLFEHDLGLVCRKSTKFLQTVFKRTLPHQRHHDEVPPILLVKVINGNNVGMFHARSEGSFLLKTVQKLRVYGQGWVKHFNGNTTIKHGIQSFINNAKTTPAKFFYNLIFSKLNFF